MAMMTAYYHAIVERSITFAPTVLSIATTKYNEEEDEREQQ